MNLYLAYNMNLAEQIEEILAGNPRAMQQPVQNVMNRSQGTVLNLVATTNRKQQNGITQIKLFF